MITKDLSFIIYNFNPKQSTDYKAPEIRLLNKTKTN